MTMIARPNAAQEYLNIGAMLKSPTDRVETIYATTPAAGAALPSIGGNVQEYVSPDREQDDYVCSGTVVVIRTGELIGIAMNDEIAGSTDSLYLIEAPRINVPLDGAATVSQGDAVYVIEATGLFTHDSIAGDFIVGKFLEAAAITPLGLPDNSAAGNYALIKFAQ